MRRRATREPTKTPLAQPEGKAAGGHVSSAISRKANYVLAGSGPGSKFAKAQELGISLIDEDSLLALLGEEGAS